MTSTFHFLGEPLLEFGHGQTAEDPHDGLSLFGPAEPRSQLPDNIVILEKKRAEKAVEEPVAGEAEVPSPAYLAQGCPACGSFTLMCSIALRTRPMRRRRRCSRCPRTPRSPRRRCP